MAKKITFSGVEIGFPSACVVCQGQAKSDYKISRVFTYGNRSITISLPVPMCESHYELATKKNAAERRIGTTGLVAGAVLGLAAVAALLSYWASSGQGSGFLNIILALILGVGVFLIIWCLAAFWIAPMFADADTKAARNAVKISRYWPGSKELELEFFNEQIAERIGRVNQERIAKAG